MDLVSVITPVYNSRQFLSQCIESVQSQTHKHWEHILVDDCSSDDSANIIQSYAQKDHRIVYIKLNENGGAGIARNKAIEMAKGNYIAFLDSDDQWHKEKLIKQMAFMQQSGHYFTFTSYDRIDEQGRSFYKIIRAKPFVTYKMALYKNPIGCLTVMYNVDFLGKEYMPLIRKRQDYALWLKLLKKTNAYGLDECLSTYRVRSNSISSNKFKLLTYEWKIYREVEGLSWFKSLFYIFSAIFIKMKNYF